MKDGEMDAHPHPPPPPPPTGACKGHLARIQTHRYTLHRQTDRWSITQTNRFIKQTSRHTERYISHTDRLVFYTDRQTGTLHR